MHQLLIIIIKDYGIEWLIKLPSLNVMRVFYKPKPTTNIR